MNTTGADEVSEILDRVKLLPSPSRITLARRILESLDSPASGEPRSQAPSGSLTRGVAVEEVVGPLVTEREPPDDEECRRIVEEERWEKYGS